MFADRKIKKLMAEYGAVGYLIYEFTKAQCYKENGYWIKYDDNFCFDLVSSLRLGTDEAFVNEVIVACVNRFGLFSESVFNELKVLTSSGIQRRYLLAKKTLTIVPEIWVIEEITEVNSKLIPLDTPLSPDKSPTSGINVTESAQSKVKESKEKESKEKVEEEEKGKNPPSPPRVDLKPNRGVDNSPPIQGFEQLETLKANALKDENFTAAFYRLTYDIKLLPGWLDAFHRWLLFCGTGLKQEGDYRKHFNNWMRNIPYATMSPPDYEPTMDLKNRGAPKNANGLTPGEREILELYPAKQ